MKTIKYTPIPQRMIKNNTQLKLMNSKSEN